MHIFLTNSISRIQYTRVRIQAVGVHNTVIAHPHTEQAHDMRTQNDCVRINAGSQSVRVYTVNTMGHNRMKVWQPTMPFILLYSIV